MTAEVIADRYLLDEKPFDRGGMADLHKGQDSHSPKTVAIKLLRREFWDNADAVGRFRREAKILSELKSRGVVHFEASGNTVNGQPFIVLEYLVGENLAKYLQHSPGGLKPERALEIWRSVVETMAYAHEEQVSHRDLKPENIFLAKVQDGKHQREEVKVLDFGIARTMDPSGDRQATQTGKLMGTWAYMAPEQLQGKRADMRADVYALGLILIKMMTGILPWKMDADPTSAAYTAYLRLKADAEPLSKLSSAYFPDPLQNLVDALLRRQPDDRPANAGEVLQLLEKVLQAVPLPWVAPPRVHIADTDPPGIEPEPPLPLIDATDTFPVHFGEKTAEFGRDSATQIAPRPITAPSTGKVINDEALFKTATSSKVSEQSPAFSDLTEIVAGGSPIADMVLPAPTPTFVPLLNDQAQGAQLDSSMSKAATQPPDGSAAPPSTQTPVVDNASEESVPSTSATATEEASGVQRAGWLSVGGGVSALSLVSLAVFIVMQPRHPRPPEHNERIVAQADGPGRVDAPVVPVPPKPHDRGDSEGTDGGKPPPMPSLFLRIKKPTNRAVTVKCMEKKEFTLRSESMPCGPDAPLYLKRDHCPFPKMHKLTMRLGETCDFSWEQEKITKSFQWLRQQTGGVDLLKARAK